MTNGHEGEGDRPVQLVEQLQIRLVLEDKTLHVQYGLFDLDVYVNVPDFNSRLL